MSGLNNFQEDPYEDRFQASIKGFLDRFISETVPNNKNTILVIIVAIVGGFFFINSQNSSSESKLQAQREELGKAMVMGIQGKTTEQAAALDILIAQSGINDIIKAKASLFRANLHYEAAEYEEAISKYNQVITLTPKQTILASGAELGVASSQIQLKKYAEAKTLLEAFIAKYGKRSEDSKERLSKGAKDDVIPTVPSALWKLALVQKELGDLASTKTLCAKIIKVYGDSNEAKQASRLVETL